MNENKSMLANTFADTVTPTMSACYRYGMTWGCDGDCPVLRAGKCNMQEENKHLLDEEE